MIVCLTVLARWWPLAAAVRSTWSPCGLSMLSTITPFSETGQGPLLPFDGHLVRPRWRSPGAPPWARPWPLLAAGVQLLPSLARGDRGHRPGGRAGGRRLRRRRRPGCGCRSTTGRSTSGGSTSTAPGSTAPASAGRSGRAGHLHHHRGRLSDGGPRRPHHGSPGRPGDRHRLRSRARAGRAADTQSGRPGRTALLPPAVRTGRTRRGPGGDRGRGRRRRGAGRLSSAPRPSWPWLPVSSVWAR